MFTKKAFFCPYFLIFFDKKFFCDQKCDFFLGCF